MLEALHRHVWSGNLNRALGANLLAVLAESAPLLWHDRLSALLLSKCLFRNDNVILLERDCRYAHTLGLNDTSFERLVVDLLVEGRVIATLSIDVVSEHVMAVVNSTNSWVDITFTVGMESRLAEVCSEGGVWQPASSIQKL